MVTQFGMSKRLGTLAIGKRSHNPFLGRDYYEERNYSEVVAKLIDEEVHNIVSTCRDRVKKMLTENRDKLDALVRALLDRETLNREEFLAVLNGDPLPALSARPDDPAVGPSSDGKEGEKAAQHLPPPRFEPGPA